MCLRVVYVQAQLSVSEQEIQEMIRQRIRKIEEIRMSVSELEVRQTPLWKYHSHVVKPVNPPVSPPSDCNQKTCPHHRLQVLFLANTDTSFFNVQSFKSITLDIYFIIPWILGLLGLKTYFLYSLVSIFTLFVVTIDNSSRLLLVYSWILLVSTWMSGVVLELYLPF